MNANIAKLMDEKAGGQIDCRKSLFVFILNKQSKILNAIGCIARNGRQDMQ